MPTIRLNMTKDEEILPLASQDLSNEYIKTFGQAHASQGLYYSI